MIRRVLGVSVLSFSAALAALPASAATLMVVNPTKSDVSAPLSTLAAAVKTNSGNNGNGPMAQPTGPNVSSGKADPVAQLLSGTLNIIPGLAFEGQSADDNRALMGGVAYVPPDTNGAVGKTQYVQTVNVTLAVYDKTSGALQLGPTLLTSVWSGFGGLCETVEGGDPVVVYDQIADRWVITQLAYDATTTHNFQCIAVSQSSDATGRYARYSYEFSPAFNDYPKFGVWPDAYYYSANMYSGRSFTGALACAFDRGAMLHGQAAAAVCFQNGSNVSTLLPANLQGNTLPPAGAPNTFVGIADATDLFVYHLHADFKTPRNSTFTGGTIPVAPFDEICARAVSVSCIQEPSPGELVDGLGDRLMFPLNYRNFGDHESLVVNHTIKGGPLAAVRWYEIRNPVAAPFVYQQGTSYDNVNDYWLGSISMDKMGNIAMGFSASSNSLFPSIYLAGHQATDPLGSMTGPYVLKAGTGVQLPNSYKRWGDYSSMSVDPSDDCTFWYTQEYYKTTGTINWATYVSSFRFPGCQ